MKSPTSASRPAKSILDPAFRYRPSHSTDLRETFERARREIQRVKENRGVAVVVPIMRKEQQ